MKHYALLLLFLLAFWPVSAQEAQLPPIAVVRTIMIDNTQSFVLCWRVPSDEYVEGNEVWPALCVPAAAATMCYESVDKLSCPTYSNPFHSPFRYKPKERKDEEI